MSIRRSLGSANLHLGPMDSENCPLDPTAPISMPPGFGPAAGPEQSGRRVSEVGQMLAKWGRNPALLSYEQLFRARPNGAWYSPDRSQTNTTQFEIAAVRPNKGEAIVLLDYSVLPFGFSSESPLDFEPLPDNFLSGCFGYSVRFNGQEPGQLKYRLDPVSSTIRQQMYCINRNKRQLLQELNADDYAITRAESFASSAGYGTGLHPQTASHYGARGVPFSEYLYDDTYVQFMGVVFRPIQTPLAFVQVQLSGVKGPSSLIKNIERDLRVVVR